jgi:serine/threonine-protein kinase
MTQSGARPEGTPKDPATIGNFRILERLGQGGMGVVYRAEDETLRRTVALKVLPATDADTEGKQRFMREARSAAAITHPNVATIHQVGEADGSLYIAMELVEGENLRTRLRHGRLDLGTARDLAEQMARGLAAAHEKGIVHRDLKPENVMITPAGVVKLLDFGLAKLDTSHPSGGRTDVGLAKTETLVTSDKGRVLGTAEYMSPEQALGEPVDVRSDVFSFGVLLYEMLAGTRPFSGTTTGTLVLAIARDTPRALRDLAPEVDETTEGVVESCLEKQPARRFANAGEIVAALSGRPPGVATESQTSLASFRRARTVRPPRTLRLSAVALALVALAGVGVGVWRWGSPGPASPIASSTAAAVRAGTPPTRTEGTQRSSSAEAQRLFEEAMRSFHDGTGQAVPLLQSAVKADPSFGAAYLRLWWMAANGQAAHEHADDYHRRVVVLQAAMTPSDRELLDCLEDSTPRSRNAKLDAHLARHPDDDVAWVDRINADDERVEGQFAAANRALAVDPTLVPVIAIEARALVAARRSDEAAKLVARCLEVSPRAAECLAARASLLDWTGDCAAAEKDVRRWLEVEPDSRDAHPLLGAILAAEGAPVDAVREALGQDTHTQTGSPFIFEAIVPMHEGAFSEVDRLARDALARVPSTAPQTDHVVPVTTLVAELTETGDTASAGRIAADYLSRRIAWKDPDLVYNGVVVAAAARGGAISQTEAMRQFDATFKALVDDGTDPSAAWACAYAAGAITRAEALAATAKLETLHLSVHPSMWPTAYARVLFLAGRADAARPLLEHRVKECSYELSNTLGWVQSHLFLGELDEQRGDRAGACGHYGRVLDRWGHAKPRSVTADEARARVKAIGCDAR